MAKTCFCYGKFLVGYQKEREGIRRRMLLPRWGLGN